MRILTNVPKAELDRLANQPTAKEMMKRLRQRASISRKVMHRVQLSSLLCGIARSRKLL